MFPNSDRYGDMDLEDVDEFEGLEPDNARPINPLGKFEYSEFRSFEADFEEELDAYDDEAIYDEEEEGYDLDEG